MNLFYFASIIFDKQLICLLMRRERDYLIRFTDFDGLRLEPRFSSLLPSLHCGESGIISSVSTDFNGLRLEPRFSSLLPSLHCGESGIISSVSTDFDGLRLEPRFSSLLPSLHCGESGIRTRGTVTRTSV